MELAVGFFIMVVPFVIYSWFGSLPVMNFYIVSFFIFSLISFKSGKLNFSAHTFTAESIQDFNRKLHRFFDETFKFVIRSWSVNILIVIIYTIFIVPVWCYMMEFRWYWWILLIVGSFFLHAFMFFSITIWFSRILGRSVVNYINDSISVDHKDYELIYRFYEDFNIQPYIKDNNDQIVKTLHHTITANLPRPRYAGKTKPSVSLSPTPVLTDDTTSLGLPFKIDNIRLYEAPSGDLAYEERMYKSSFISEDLSFLFVEVTITEVINIEYWKEEITFMFLTQNRIVTGEIKQGFGDYCGGTKKWCLPLAGEGKNQVRGTLENTFWMCCVKMRVLVSWGLPLPPT